MSAPRVLVTGASGYIATHVVQQLQQSGQYLVRGTVRSLKNPDKVAPLRKLCKNPKYEVELVEADLEKDDGWAEAVKGCTYVLHMASPFPLAEPAHEDEVIRPAVDGTLRVLKAVAQVGGVKRVVLTSSGASIVSEFKGGPKVYSEKDWTDTSDSSLSAYHKSKPLAEKAAWDYIKGLPADKKFELAVINPVLVMGPALCGTPGTSMNILKMILEPPMPQLPQRELPSVDVRDVARAHVIAMTLPEAGGNRHLLCTGSIFFSDMADYLAEFKGLGYNLAEIPGPKADHTKFDTSRMLKVLKIQPIDLKKTMTDMAYSMIEQGHIKKTAEYTAKAHPPATA